MARLPDATLDAVAARLCSLTGTARQAMRLERLAAAVSALLAGGAEPSDLLRALEQGGPPRLQAPLLEAVSVGETYLFRQPAHFDWLAAEVLPRWLQPGRRVRAWSAGCATGEEAWSLAGCLARAFPPGCGVGVEVLGTDLSERALAVAREGRYGRWSLRQSGGDHWPLAGTASGEELVVHPHLRELVRFAAHNLLQPPPETGFDVVFCRNVLVYFTPDAAQRAVAHLAASLAEGAVLVFAPVDVVATPPGLVPTGPPELCAFRRPSAVARAPTPVPPARPAAPSATPAPRCGPDPVAVHCRVLELVERHELAQAARVLDELLREVPDYLPGMLERALLCHRAHDQARTRALMSEIVARTERVSPDALVDGPEQLSVSYYRISAQAFLERSSP